MEDGKDEPRPEQADNMDMENAGSPAEDLSSDSEGGKKGPPRSIKEVSQRLKKEAIRRYREKQGDEVLDDDSNSIDVHADAIVSGQSSTPAAEQAREPSPPIKDGEGKGSRPTSATKEQSSRSASRPTSAVNGQSSRPTSGIKGQSSRPTSATKNPNESRPTSGIKGQSSRPTSAAKTPSGSRPTSGIKSQISRPASAAKSSNGSRPTSATKTSRPTSATKVPHSKHSSARSAVNGERSNSASPSKEQSPESNPQDQRPGSGAKDQSSRPSSAAKPAGSRPGSAAKDTGSRPGSGVKPEDTIEASKGEDIGEEAAEVPAPEGHSVDKQEGEQPAEVVNDGTSAQSSEDIGGTTDAVPSGGTEEPPQDLVTEATKEPAAVSGSQETDGDPSGSSQPAEEQEVGEKGQVQAVESPPHEDPQEPENEDKPTTPETQQASEPSSQNQSVGDPPPLPDQPKDTDEADKPLVSNSDGGDDDQPEASHSQGQRVGDEVEPVTVKDPLTTEAKAKEQLETDGENNEKSETAEDKKPSETELAEKKDVPQTEKEEKEKNENLVGAEPGENKGEPTADDDGETQDIRGDEDEITVEEVQQKVKKTLIPDDFFYKNEEHISKATVSEDSGIPQDLLSVSHSFGYDARKRANLHMVDEDTAVFAAGNIVELLNLTTKKQRYLHSTSGGGIGALAIHPKRTYIAVAEKGEAPNINVYEYPSLRLYRIMRGGTERSYAFADFSPDGNLLASVGGDPDYMLTLWDWKQEKTVLRSKAFSQDVFRVTFSSELQGQLTSAGTGHIRFWKMANTFTGLKLQGQLGKFGKTEITDIVGYVELPDGKVLSGSEWGNLLLWDGGLIKVEISRRGDKPCHTGAIQQIIMDEGELMTIGVDGFIRVWDFEKVDTADSTDDSGIYEMEPMNEMKVGSNVQLHSVVKSVNPEEPTMWYAQDANGGIWKLDLSFSFTSLAPEKLMSFHSGMITGCDTSPVTHLVATTGIDHTVRVYDYLAKAQVCEAKFAQPGTSLLWPSRLVDPKGATLIVGFEDGVVRVFTFQKKDNTDPHNRKQKDPSELVLRHALKPHTGRVAAMGIDSKGEILATGGDDCSLFFLSVTEDFEPIGFVKTPSPVTSMDWSPSRFDKNTLLVCCLEGEVLELHAPEPGNFDTSKTYQITGLPIRCHNFKSVKSRLRHEEEIQRKAKEEEDRKSREEEERRKRIERGLETESEQGEEEQEEEEEEEEEDTWEPFIPSEPSPILCGFHGREPGSFWLSMGAFDAGYLYECQFMDEEDKSKMPADQLYEPTKSVPVTHSDDMPIVVMKKSLDGKRLIMGLEDGSVRIHQLPTEDEIGILGPYWRQSIHDNDYGNITYISSSFDEKHLFTVGADGNFFTFQVMDQEKTDKKIVEAKAKLPSAKPEDEVTMLDDIEDPSAYSIEDAKQKSEYDKMMRLAEEKKTGVRGTIQGLRNEFTKLLDKNAELPKHLQLNRKEFEMDIEIKHELERQTQEKIEIVKKEMAWEEEKHRVALDKLRSRFKDVVECERIVVKAFLTSHEVASFRASKLPDEFYIAQAELEKRKTTATSRDEASRQATHDLLKGQTQDTTDLGGSGTQETAEARVTTTLKGSMGERINKALAKVEEKKKKRAARKAQWENLNGGKPSDDYEDPLDVAAIQQAQENMGDYKLKSADDYVVPDHLRMNTEKARARLLMLKDLIHKRKYDFNQRLLSLRDKKICIIEEIQNHVIQLGHVQSKLTPDQGKAIPGVPKLHPEEIPEKKLEFTRESLLKFKAEKEEKEANAARGVASETGFGGFAAGADTVPDDKNESLTPTQSSSSYRQMSMLTTEQTGDELDWISQQEDDTQLSDLEKQIRKAEEIRHLYERDRLLIRIQDLLKNFDAELRCLRHDKFKLDIELKNADLRQVTLFEELLLLKDFEKRENVLAAKVEGKQQERLDMQAKVIDVLHKLELKKKDIEKQLEKERALHMTFMASLGENNKFADYLAKVFKKKIKRSKKKAAEGEGSDEESDDDSDDESDWSESDEESDSEAGGYDLDVCPAGCDQNLYDNTCGLREKRLDIEELIAEEKKNRDAFNKEVETLNKKAKVIDGALKQAENELEAFQLEKQRKLNELDVVVTLKMNQIQYVNNNMLPQDLSQSLVFEASGAVRLHQRIRELEHEKGLQKKQQKEAKKKHVQLIKDRKLFQQRIGEMEETCNKMMMQKFGGIVDLEKLETVTVNRNMEELKEKLRVNEITSSQELTKWDETISEKKDRITELIRENTDRLDQLNMLLAERKNYEGELDSRQKNLGGEFSGARQTDLHERQRLMQLVQLQAQEIEALKEEITLLSNKGGHILPPTQPPMIPSSAPMHAISNV